MKRKTVDLTAPFRMLYDVCDDAVRKMLIWRCLRWPQRTYMLTNNKEGVNRFPVPHSAL
jgi:hypothetical protein